MIDASFLWLVIICIIIVAIIRYEIKKSDLIKQFDSWVNSKLPEEDFKIYEKYKNPSMFTVLKFKGVFRWE
jgi:hypothetical protein